MIMIKLTRMGDHDNKPKTFYLNPDHIVIIEPHNEGINSGVTYMDGSDSACWETVVEPPEIVIAQIQNANPIAPVLTGFLVGVDQLMKERFDSTSLDNRMRLLENIATARQEGDHEMEQQFKELLVSVTNLSRTPIAPIVNPVPGACAVPVPKVQCNSCRYHKTLPTDVPCAQCLDAENHPNWEAK